MFKSVTQSAVPLALLFNAKSSATLKACAGEGRTLSHLAQMGLRTSAQKLIAHGALVDVGDGRYQASWAQISQATDAFTDEFHS